MADPRLNADAQALVDGGKYILVEDGNGGCYMMPAHVRAGGEMKFAGASPAAPAPRPAAAQPALPPPPAVAPPDVVAPVQAPVEKPVG